MNPFRRQLGFASLLGFLLFLALAGFFCAVNAHGADNLRYLTRPVLPTGSMLPLLKGGEILRVECVPFGELHKGQIVLAWWKSRHLFVCHRLTHQWPDGSWTTEGDNKRCRPDEIPLTPDSYRGVVIEIIP
jgi:hypothetical protein